MQSVTSSAPALAGARFFERLTSHAEYKEKTYRLVPPACAKVLDLGSGVGDDALALAEGLGPETTVVGIEQRLELVEEATRRARNVALNVRFGVGNVYSLPFDDGSFEVVRADGLFGELDDCGRALREIVRVARRGALLLISDRHDVVVGHSPSRFRGGERRGATDLLALFAPAGLSAARIEDVFALAGADNTETEFAFGVTVSARTAMPIGGPYASE